MAAYNANDTLVSSQYGSPSLRHKNPYQRRPERETWTEYEVRQSSDGTQYTAQREVSRWGGEYSEAAWAVVPGSEVECSHARDPHNPRRCTLCGAWPLA